MSSEYCLTIDIDLDNVVEGEVTKVSVLSFLGDIDKEKGIVISRDSGCYGCDVKDRVLVVEKFRGSTVGTYVLYSLCRRGVAPKAILCSEPDPVVIAGAILCKIPIIYGLPINFLSSISTGDRIRIEVRNGKKICVFVEKVHS